MIGSHTFDLLVPIGASAVIHPFSIPRDSILFDLTAIGLLAAYLAFRRGLRGRLNMRDAIGLLAFYGGYVLFRLGTVVGEVQAFPSTSAGQWLLDTLRA